MTVSLESNAFVGRERELTELSSALESSLNSRGQLVMLVGEPGIGKTRLAEEITARATSDGALIGWGACFEMGSTPPYWLWTQVIRSLLVDASDSTLRSLRDHASVIAEIVPELAELSPDITPPPKLDSTYSRFRLFDAVSSFLHEVSAEQSVVIVLDDLHWADQSSLDLLEFAARGVASNPILIIGGYRDTELTRQHPLSHSLASLARIRGFSRILLRGLEADDVGHLVAAVGAIGVPADLIREIHVRTEGNPFFVSEITRDMANQAIDQGGGFDAFNFRVTEGVREAIGIRLNGLSESCNQVLRTAAVIGRKFEFRLLTLARPDLQEDELLDALEEALGSGAIREIPGELERYEFSHALIQETLSNELSSSRRARLHARILEAIETSIEAEAESGRSDGDHRISELAFHSAQAELIVGTEKVIHYARRAGEVAMGSYAWADARLYFEKALSLDESKGPSENRAAILFGLGAAELISLTFPDVQRGWDNVERSFDLYAELGDQKAAVDVLVRVRGFPTVWIHGASRAYSRALEMVPPGSLEAGQMLLQLEHLKRFDEQDVAGSLQDLEQALEIAKNTDDRVLESQVLPQIAWNMSYAGDLKGAIEVGTRAIELTQETEQPLEEQSAQFIVGLSNFAIGNHEDALRNAGNLQLIGEKFGQLQILVGDYWIKYNVAYLSGDVEVIAEAGGWFAENTPNDSSIRLFARIGACITAEPPDMDELIRGARQTVLDDPSVEQRGVNRVLLAIAAHFTDRVDEAKRTGDIVRSILAEPNISPILQDTSHPG